VSRLANWGRALEERWKRPSKIDPMLDNFVSAYFIGMLLAQFRTGPDHGWLAVLGPFLGMSASMIFLLDRSPGLALVVAAAGELIGCATGGTPTYALGSVVVAAAATVGPTGGPVVLFNLSPRPPDARRPNRLRAELNVAMIAAAVVVGGVPWILDLRSDPVFSGAPRDHPFWQTPVLIMVAILVRSNWSLVGRLLRGATERAEEAEAQRVQAVADERRRIARELHDVVAHQMSVVVTQAQGAQAVIADDPSAARRALGTISDATRDALVELRRLVAVSDRGDGPEEGPQPGLTPEDLARLSASAEAAGLRVDLHVALDGTVPPGAGLSAFRIVQEALTNAAKHAPGSTVRVDVKAESADLRLEVRNGPARTGTRGQPGGGAGLVGMRERVELFGGTLAAGPTADGGWSVLATFPTLEPSSRSE
jgi:signal transduction histidine kinase